jgi:hypothetical protein
VLEKRVAVRMLQRVATSSVHMRVLTTITRATSACVCCVRIDDIVKRSRELHRLLRPPCGRHAHAPPPRTRQAGGDADTLARKCWASFDTIFLVVPTPTTPRPHLRACAAAGAPCAWRVPLQRGAARAPRRARGALAGGGGNRRRPHAHAAAAPRPLLALQLACCCPRCC